MNPRFYKIILIGLMLIVPGMSVQAVGVGDGEVTNQYCPVTTDEKVDPNVFFDYQGQRIHFCCNHCKREFIADPNAYMDNLILASAESATQATDGHQTTHDTVRADSVEPPATDVDEDHDHQGAAVAIDAHDHEAAAGHHDETAEETGHDHDHDHGDGSGFLGLMGKYHVVVIHFPIALVLLSAAFVLIRLLGGGRQFEVMAAIIMYWGAVSAIFAVLLGLARASGTTFPDELTAYFSWHRTMGLITAGLSILTAVAGHTWRRSNSRASLLVFRALVLVNAIVVGITGHLGGSLVFGPNYYG